MSNTGLRALKDLTATHSMPSQWASEFSEEVHVVAAVDDIAPEPPENFAANPVTAGVELTWDNPSLNENGFPCHDLACIEVYSGTEAAIDPDDSDSYDKVMLVDGDSFRHNSEDTETVVYFVLRARDRTGNQSQPTSELSATPANSGPPAGVVPADATGLIFNDDYGSDGVVEGYGKLGIAFKSLPATVVRMERIRLWYQYTTDGGTNWRDEDGVVDQWTELFPDGFVGFLHKGLDQSGTRAYRYKAVFRAEDEVESTTPDTAGGASTTADGSNDSSLVTISFFAENIVSIGEVRGDSIYGQSEIVISGNGYIKSSNYSSGLAGFKIDGDGDAEFNDVVVRGAIIAESGSEVDWSYIDNVVIQSADIYEVKFGIVTAGQSDSSLTVGGYGYLQSGNYQSGVSGFRIEGDGDAEFNDVTVRGKLIAGTGSEVDWDYIQDVSLTVDQLTVNDDMQFYESGWHSIKGINGLYYSSTKSTSSDPYITFTSGILTLASPGSTDAIEINAGQHINILSDYGIVTIMSGTASGDTVNLGRGSSTRLIITDGNDVGIMTTSPGRILDVNQGSGNMIADGYDSHSLAEYKEEIVIAPRVLDKFKQLAIHKYRRRPHVSSEELKDAVIKKFGKKRWDALYPNEMDYRGKKLLVCPDEEVLAFMDGHADKLRAKRRKEARWQEEQYGLVADDPTLNQYAPELTAKKDGKIIGVSLSNSVGYLMAVVQELAAKVDELEARI